jgi:hypothetical protein
MLFDDVLLGATTVGKITTVFLEEVVVGDGKEVMAVCDGFHATQDLGRSTNNLRDDDASALPLPAAPDFD